MSRPPVKVSHSITLQQPPAAHSSRPPASAATTKGTNRGRSPSPIRLPKPLLSSTPNSSVPPRSVARSARSTVKASSNRGSEPSEYNLTPIEILQVAKLIEEANPVSTRSSSQESLKTLIQRVRSGNNGRICDMHALTTFIHYPTFSTSGFGSVGQLPDDSSSFNGSILSGKVNDRDDHIANPLRSKNSVLLDDFKKPDEILKMEQLVKATKDLKKQRLERIRLKHLAERNEILPPHLISSVQKDVDALTDSLEKFYSSDAYDSLKNKQPQPTGVPCPIAKRKEIIQIFENLEKISSTQFSTDQKIDEGKLEEYIQHLISKTSAKANSIESSNEAQQNSTKRNKDLLNQLDQLKEL